MEALSFCRIQKEEPSIMVCWKTKAQVQAVHQSPSLIPPLFTDQNLFPKKSKSYANQPFRTFERTQSSLIQRGDHCDLGNQIAPKCEPQQEEAPVERADLALKRQACQGSIACMILQRFKYLCLTMSFNLSTQFLVIYIMNLTLRPLEGTFYRKAKQKQLTHRAIQANRQLITRVELLTRLKQRRQKEVRDLQNELFNQTRVKSRREEQRELKKNLYMKNVEELQQLRRFIYENNQLSQNKRSNIRTRILSERKHLFFKEKKEEAFRNQSMRIMRNADRQSKRRTRERIISQKERLSRKKQKLQREAGLQLTRDFNRSIRELLEYQDELQDSNSELQSQQLRLIEQIGASQKRKMQILNQLRL